jgi:cell division transport system permease protein
MAAQTEYYEEEEKAPIRAVAEDVLPRSGSEASIVPADSIAGRALLAVIAIMTFLAALTLGGVVLVRSAAGEWQSAVAREITIQLRPSDQRDIEADVRKAATLASGTPGIATVRAYTKQESARLLEPWLGSGLVLDELPVPRLIVVRIAAGEPPDLAALAKTLAEQIPGATLDDHRVWVDRMRAMARSAVAVGLSILALVLAATMLSVMFATRGAMSTNRQIIEVLFVVGAKAGFIAGEFQRHFCSSASRVARSAASPRWPCLRWSGRCRTGSRVPRARARRPLCSEACRLAPRATARSSASSCWLPP